MESEKLIIANRYQIVSLIGKGGMANVYTAKDLRLGRIVAIKILNSSLVKDDTFRARFTKEAQAVASLNSGNIVAIYDSGTDMIDGADTPYLVMEYIEGRTLEDEIKAEKIIPVQRAVEITESILDGLSVAHARGIIHRDIKPGNIMLTQNGGVKIMDFGIARAIEEDSVSITKTNTVVGTAKYISPEQARGEKVDKRSDLYSLGCIFYEMLTGRPPFVGDSAISIAYQHAKEDFQLPSAINNKVPESLDAIVAKALAKDPDSRFQNGLEFKDALDKFKANPSETAVMPADKTQVLTPITTSPNSSRKHDTANIAVNQAPNQKKSRKKLITALIIIGALLIGGIAWGVVTMLHKDNNTVKIPACANLSPTDLKTQLENVGLFTNEAFEESTTVPIGKTTRCNPETGATAKRGDTVIYFVSSVSDLVVPDVSGMTQQQARETLELMGFQIGNVETKNSAKIAKGYVVKTDPKAGETAKKGDSITLYISSGQIKIPDFVGMSKDDAAKAIEKAGLVLGTVTTEESDQAENTVIDQDPPAGTLVSQETTINLTVAIAAKTYTLPNFIKKSQDYVSEWFDDRGLNYTFQPLASSAIPEGLVVSTDPQAGSTISSKDTVIVYVSSG